MVGFWPADADGDDIRAVTPTSARDADSRPCFTLRQQLAKRDGTPNVALADFVAPRASGVADYIGAFVVTAGIEEDAIAERFERANDDYSSILVKALADRFAEAFAERMHARVRREFWGYAPDETLAPEELIARELSRHPPRARLSRPARPHREGDAVRAARRRGARSACRLTESFAMWPGSSVSGLYFAPSGERIISASPRSSATRSRTTPRARAWRVARGRALAGAGAQLLARAGGGGVAARASAQQRVARRVAFADAALNEHGQTVDRAEDRDVKSETVAQAAKHRSFRPGADFGPPSSASRTAKPRSSATAIRTDQTGMWRPKTARPM